MEEKDKEEKKSVEKEIDWDKLMDEFEASLEKYAQFDEEHKRWNRKNRSLKKDMKDVEAFIKENELSEVEISEKGEGENGQK